MFFLLRTAFWLSVVLALLPSGGGQGSKPASLGASEAVSAATAAVSDVSQFCDRQPDVCVVGSQAAVAFGQRAQAGAKMVYDFVSEKAAEKLVADKAEPEKSTPAETGSIKMPVSAKSSQHTLRPADLQPTWRGPAPRRETASKHPA